jgi:hypothetical protein
VLRCVAQIARDFGPLWCAIARRTRRGAVGEADAGEAGEPGCYAGPSASLLGQDDLVKQADRGR